MTSEEVLGELKKNFLLVFNQVEKKQKESTLSFCKF